jgi:hypothetical protein
MYYEGNSIQGIQRALQGFLSDSDAWTTAVPTLRARLEEVFSIAAKRTEWQAVLTHTCSTTVPPSINVLDDVSPLVIAFDDMWPGFNYDRNFIMDALRHEQPGRDIKGLRYTEGLNANLLLFGPYSEGWKRVTTIPKVYVSGENWPHPADSSVSLFISSQSMEDGTHMRVPTWMHFIDWFTDSTTLPTNLDDNPIRLPLHAAVTPHPVSFEKREKFCAFVVSNPICQIQGGSLNVKLSLPESYKDISLGWSLFKDSNFIAIGTSSTQQCSLTGSSVWPQGSYLFCIQAFKEAQPLGKGQISWIVGAKGLAILSYGNYDDNTTPLRLQ